MVSTMYAFGHVRLDMSIAPFHTIAGNDFLPHMPSLEIRNGAIDTLCDLYLSVFGKLGGWITDGGSVNLARVRTFCTELGGMEEELLKRHQNSEDRFKAQQKKRDWEKANGGCG